MFDSWLEFFASFFGDTVFAKLLAGFFTLLSPILFLVSVGAVFAVLSFVLGPLLGPLAKKYEEFVRSGKAFALHMSIRRHIRDLFKR